jgi:two-component system sensor histidine kinase KdpD
MRSIPQHVRQHLYPTLIGAAAIAAITAVLVKYEPYLPTTHLVFVYLLPITVIANIYGSTPAMATSLVSIIAADYFLIPPRFDFRMEDPLHIAELVYFSLISLLASKAIRRLQGTNSKA